MHINLEKAVFNRRFGLLLVYASVQGINIVLDMPSWDTINIYPIDNKGDYLEQDLSGPLLGLLGEFWETFDGKRDGNRFYMEGN